jgi:D-arginine dehydrogenase
MKKHQTFEGIIIGCGIAGASAAYFLSQQGITDLLILEKEDQPAYHATGRSAAVLVEMDLVPSVLELKLIGARFLRDPPEGFSENPLLQPSGILILFQGALWTVAQEMVPRLRERGAAVDVLSPDEAKEVVSAVSPENFDGAIHLPQDGRLDVNELLWSYLRHAKRRGVQLRLGEEVTGLSVEGGRCRGVRTDKGLYKCGWVVNAAGAWGGKVRGLAGPSPILLTPYRRTIVTFPAPDGLDVTRWPLCADLSHDFYFGPESSGILASPMDEEPMEPCDARPDDMTVALTMERIKRFTPSLVPQFVRSKWAGLRTFAADQALVVGEDPEVKGFFWLSGQGGCGIETSPVVGSIAADLILSGKTEMMDVTPISPERFAG